MKLAVTSTSFSKNDTLRKRISEIWKGEIIFNEEGKKFTKSELIRFLDGCDTAIVGLDNVDEEVLENLPELRFISKYGVGLDNIDLDACEKKGVSIGWTGGVNKLSVAEMTLGFSITLIRNLYQSSGLLSEGTWKKNGGSQLSGKTIGIIGFGHVGKEFYRLLSPFQCNVLVNDIDPSVYEGTGITNQSLEAIFQQADLISLHVPYSKTTKGLIDLEAMKKMKKKPILLNTARGGIVNEEDLITGLDEGLISAVGIDAYVNEPQPSSALISRKDVFCTPHIGGNASEAVLAMGNSAIDNLMEIVEKNEKNSSF